MGGISNTERWAVRLVVILGALAALGLGSLSPIPTAAPPNNEQVSAATRELKRIQRLEGENSRSARAARRGVRELRAAQEPQVQLPAVAMGSEEVLRAERALVLFSAFLLFAVPVFRGMQGELPIELSARGARYAERTAEASEKVLDELVERASDQEELSANISEVVGSALPQAIQALEARLEDHDERLEQAGTIDIARRLAALESRLKDRP